MKMPSRLRTKLTLMMTLLVLMPTLTTGLYALYIGNDTLKTQAFLRPIQDAKGIKNRVETFLATAKNEVMFLSQSTPMTDYLSVRSTIPTSNTLKTGTAAEMTTPSASEDTTQKTLETKRQALEQELLAFIRNRGIYYQIAYLDETGQEVVRVVSDGLRNKTMESDRLQDYADSQLFTEAMRLAGKQVFVSPLTLNRTGGGTLETPHKPVIHYAVNVSYENDRKAGIVVCTIDANQLLKLLGETLVVNEGGYFINHPDPQKRWGSPDDLDTKYNLDQEYSPDLAKQILGQVGTLTTNTLTLFTDVIYVPGTAQHWTLIVQRNTAEVLNNLWTFRLTFGLLFGTMILTALILGQWFIVKISRPIEQLAQLADAMSQGEQLDQRIVLQGTGEIGILAQAFERMRISMVRSFDRLRNPPK